MAAGRCSFLHYFWTVCFLLSNNSSASPTGLSSFLQYRSADEPSTSWASRVGARLLRRFPGETASALRQMARHLRAKRWLVSLAGRTMVVDDFMLVAASNDSDAENDNDVVREDIALTIQELAVNWTSYKEPVVDCMVNNATVLIHLDELARLKPPSTNWQRLRASPFPPPFVEEALRRARDAPLSPVPPSSLLSSLFSPSPTAAPRFRSFQCLGDVVVECSATILGRRVGAAAGGADIGSGGGGLPNVRIPGAVFTAVWEQALQEWRDAEGDVCRDPSTGKELHRFQGMTPEEFAAALTRVLARVMIERLDEIRGIGDGVASIFDHFAAESLGVLRKILEDAAGGFVAALSAADVYDYAVRSRLGGDGHDPQPTT